MFRVLRFPVNSSPAAVARAVRRTPARDIALVFPLGMPSLLSYLERMETLHALCSEVGKQATIVGGDALLRATAVAAGLPAAVTLEDWKLGRGESGAGWRSGWRSRRQQTVPQLELVALPESAAEDTVFDDTDCLDVDPPDYVLEILALSGRARADDDEPRGRQLRAPAVWAGSLAYDRPDFEPFLALSEEYEERVTGAIRATSGLGPAPWIGDWSSAPSD
jgi:hypothetical protein